MGDIVASKVDALAVGGTPRCRAEVFAGYPAAVLCGVLDAVGTAIAPE